MSGLDPKIELLVSSEVEKCRAYAEQKAEAARAGATDTLRFAFTILGVASLIITLSTAFGLGPLVKAKVDSVLASADATAVLRSLEADAQEVSGLKKAVIAGKSFGWVPVGSIVPFHKNILEDVALKLPNDQSWVECTNPDDTKMVWLEFDDKNRREVKIPHLNYDGGRFLRGAEKSGIWESDAFQGHKHSVHTDAGTELRASGSGTGAWGSNVLPRDLSDAGNYKAQAPITDGINGAPRIANETRPVNMSVVWIMRVK